MSLKSIGIPPIPAETARIAHAAFPKGTFVLTLRDELGPIYADSDFAALFPADGHPAFAPWRLALVTVLQFAENLTDRQAADAVRSRIDWKYLLSLSLDDSGFNYSILSEFRTRLVTGKAEHVLFDTFLTLLKERGLLKAQGSQRSDSTHVLAAVRSLNRIQCIGETLRAALNSLAVAAPEWLQKQVHPDWYVRYAVRIEDYRLPKDPAKRDAWVMHVGNDGYTLLRAIYTDPAMTWLANLPAVNILRQVWVQQFRVESDATVVWRDDANVPPGRQFICSPYDTDVSAAKKRTTWWIGYKVHVTETCDPDSPRLVTHVLTTTAAVSDVKATPEIHRALKDTELLPAVHVVDTGYTEATAFAASRKDYGIDLLGPTYADTKWQATQKTGFAAANFRIDWAAQQATCPTGHISSSWTPAKDRYANAVIKIKFAYADCMRCPSRPQCTKTTRRLMTVRPQEGYEALQVAREREKTAEFRQQYAIRAGIEATLSQGVRVFDLRHARYRGAKKTHLQHMTTATALNMVRTVAWLDEIPLAKTRVSHFAKLKPAA